MKKIVILFSFAGMLFCCISLHGQTTVSINPVKDNTLYENATGSISNGTGDHFFVGLNNLSSKRRGLIKFDIASTVPSGATILEASLTLTMDQTNSEASNVELHTVSADWGEGASVAITSGGSGAPAQTTDATWLHNFYDHSFWNTAGGDFNASISATTSVNGIGIYNWTSSQLVADVQKWLDSPTLNFGWCLIGNETIQQSAMRFASKEIATPTSRPLLTIVYTDPVGIHELNSNSRCMVFPNPTSGMLQLAVRNVDKAEVKIFSTAGLAVYSQPIIADQLTIDLSHKPGGVYFYELLSNNQIIETGKFILKK
ncbi:MAG TPA: DNRLRE domain-containing protein [Prolixibacteraceae bacterium]|nr:DNRLRE domain-containing protein [Prolixibacteraceae bacterium]